jgi:hypothetical protein
MDLFDLIPFRNEMVKVYHCLTDNATHTSEKPIFSELKVRRYEKPLNEVADLIIDKIDRWVGWNLKSEKTAVGGMSIIRAEVLSFALLGMKINATFGLIQETDARGNIITTVNAKAETQIESKGDLGESRRILRMMLAAMDFEFRKEMVREDDYLFRSIDPKGSTAAFQQLFDEARLEHRKTAGKSTKIEFTKKPSKQAIPYKSAAKNSEQPSLTAMQQGIPVEQNSSAPGAASSSVTEPEIKASKPKVTIITMKKNS